MNISVVIPMYNRENTIETAIMSVLNQTVRPMEIIVVDDCSTDASVKVVKELRKKSKMIRLIRLQRNSGAQVARNCGIKVAQGDWILFLDSDDELLNNAVEIQQEEVKMNPGFDVYYGNYYLKKNGKFYYRNCRMDGQEGNFFHSVMFASKAIFPGLLVRKTALEEIGLLDVYVPAYQEWDTQIRLSLQHKYFYINKILFIYNVYDGETISNDTKKGVKGFRYVVMKNGDLFLKEDGIKSIIFYYDGMYFRYKKCNDYRQYYYLCMLRIFQLILSKRFLQDRCIRIMRSVWRLNAAIIVDQTKRNGTRRIEKIQHRGNR